VERPHGITTTRWDHSRLPIARRAKYTPGETRSPRLPRRSQVTSLRPAANVVPSVRTMRPMESYRRSVALLASAAGSANAMRAERLAGLGQVPSIIG